MWEGGETLTRSVLGVAYVCVCVRECVRACACVCVLEDGVENVETRHKQRLSSFIWSMKKAAGFMCSRELTR